MFSRIFFILLASLVALSLCESSEKPGTCPVFERGTVGSCIVECSSDLGCKEDLKCCPNPCGGGGLCMKSAEALLELANKPGNCPAAVPDYLDRCTNMCNDDSICSGDQKCCTTVCGGRTCADPIVS